MQQSYQQPMDVFERVLQGVLRDSAHSDRLALALPLLARSSRRSDSNLDPMAISHPTNPFIPSNRRADASSHRRAAPPRALSPLNSMSASPLPDVSFQPLASIPQQLQSLSSPAALPSASKLLEHVSLSKLDHTLAAASQQVDETTAALALAWGNEWSTTVRREMRHDFAAREPIAALPRPPPKLTSKQLAVKMLSRAPPPVTCSMAFDEEDETPNSGMSCVRGVAFGVMQGAGTWLTIMKHTPQFITCCVPGKWPLFYFSHLITNIAPVIIILISHRQRAHPAAGGEPFSTPEQRGDPAALQQNALSLRAARADGSGLPMKIYDSFDSILCIGGRCPSRPWVPNVTPWYRVKSAADTTLVFEARFESGNLKSAIRVAEYEYDCTLRNDMFTDGHTQWFFFSVSNVRKGVPYRFNFLNLYKSDSLYNHGLLPLTYSVTNASNGVGWVRSGTQVCYYNNGIRRLAKSKKNARMGKPPAFFYTLTFTLEFQHDNDTVYLAHCYPYPYTALCRHLHCLETDPIRRHYIRRRQMCKTTAGNSCDIITITEPNGDRSRRLGIVLSARVHPGESNASWMMHGIIDFLTSDNAVAVALRRRFLFRIVPMLNPDGVINGNYRCSLSGHDLNRRWLKPDPALHPEIVAFKNMLDVTARERPLMMFCDLHGHSNKKNMFVYGCAAEYWRQQDGEAPAHLSENVFPWLLSSHCDFFHFNKCSYSVKKGKEGTGRAVTWRQIRAINAFTMEVSFSGASIGSRAGYHFSLDDLKGVGPSFCRAIAAAWCPTETSTHLPLHPAIRQALNDPGNAVVAACRKDGPDFVYPPAVSVHAHNNSRQNSTPVPMDRKGDDDDTHSNSSESQEAPDAVVRLPPPRADISFAPVFALSLSFLQQAAAAAAASFLSSKKESSLIDCIPGFEIVRASGFVDEGRGIDSECGSDSEGGKDGVCLDTSDDEELVVKLPPPPKNDQKRKKGKKSSKRKEVDQFDWMTVEAGVDGEQVEPLTPLPARSAGELNTQYRAKIKGATVDKEALASALALDPLEKPKDLGKALFQTKIKSRLAEVAALGRSAVSDGERAWNSSASETSEKEDAVPGIQSIPVQLIRMVPPAAVSAATMQRAVSHATMSNLTRATASASSRLALSAQRPRSNSMEALLEEVSYKPLQPYSFPTGSIQPSHNGRHEFGEQYSAPNHPQLASASSRLDRLRLQRLLRSMEGLSNIKSRSPNLDPLVPPTLPPSASSVHSSTNSSRMPRKGDAQPSKKKEEPPVTQSKPSSLSVVTVEWL